MRVYYAIKARAEAWAPKKCWKVW